MYLTLIWPFGQSSRSYEGQGDIQHFTYYSYIYKLEWLKVYLKKQMLQSKQDIYLL